MQTTASSLLKLRVNTENCSLDSESICEFEMMKKQKISSRQKKICNNDLLIKTISVYKKRKIYKEQRVKYAVKSKSEC